MSTIPREAEKNRRMALAAMQQGDSTAALDHMAKAVRFSSDPTLKFRYGSLLAHTGNLEEANDVFQAALSEMPDHAEGWYLRGLVLVRLKRDPEARKCLKEAIATAPTELRALKALADLEFNSGFPADALPLWERLAKYPKATTDVTLRLGETLSRLGQHDRALALYSEAIERHPLDADLWMAYAQAQEDAGEKDLAAHAYERAAALRPGWAFPLAGLLSLKRAHADQARVDEASRKLESSETPDADRAMLGYELGKVFDGRGDYNKAIACWKTANAARIRMTGSHPPQWIEGQVDRTIAIFTSSRIQAGARLGSLDERPVFIVGMPRSGTTLSEQIIASHPAAHGCGELPDLALVARRLAPILSDQLEPQTLSRAISRYLEAATRHAPTDAVRLVDKAPLNFFHLGLVAILFPRARVIWCRRDPRDIAISIYGENFALDEKLATRMDTIGHYINAQTRLMRHWQRILPLQIHESRYESLASSIELYAPKLLSAAGLPWDAACLNFHENKRGVQTPSRWQVRQPIHTRSIGRWRNYEAALEPLLDILQPDSF